MAKPSEQQDISIAVITTDIKYIKESLIKIDQRLDIMDSNYVKREELNAHRVIEEEFKKEYEKRVRDIELDSATFKSQVKTWGTILIILVGVAEFAINKFL